MLDRATGLVGTREALTIIITITIIYEDSNDNKNNINNNNYNNDTNANNASIS